MERPPNYGEQNAAAVVEGLGMGHPEEAFSIIDIALQAAFNAGIEKVAPSVAELHEGNRLLTDSVKSLSDYSATQTNEIGELWYKLAKVKKDLKKERRASAKFGERAAKLRAELQEQVVEARASALAGSRARSRQEMWADAWIRVASSDACRSNDVATGWADRMLREFDSRFGAPATKLEDGE